MKNKNSSNHIDCLAYHCQLAWYLEALIFFFFLLSLQWLNVAVPPISYIPIVSHFNFIVSSLYSNSVRQVVVVEVVIVIVAVFY